MAIGQAARDGLAGAGRLARQRGHEADLDGLLRGGRNGGGQAQRSGHGELQERAARRADRLFGHVPLPWSENGKAQATASHVPPRARPALPCRTAREGAKLRTDRPAPFAPPHLRHMTEFPMSVLSAALQASHDPAQLVDTFLATLMIPDPVAARRYCAPEPRDRLHRRAEDERSRRVRRVQPLALQVGEEEVRAHRGGRRRQPRGDGGLQHRHALRRVAGRHARSPATATSTATSCATASSSAWKCGTTAPKSCSRAPGSRRL